jgi:hypothetical protein
LTSASATTYAAARQQGKDNADVSHGLYVVTHTHAEAEPAAVAGRARAREIGLLEACTRIGQSRWRPAKAGVDRAAARRLPSLLEVRGTQLRERRGRGGLEVESSPESSPGPPGRRMQPRHPLGGAGSSLALGSR